MGYVGAKPEVNYPESLAAEPVYSNGNKTVTVTLNGRYKWSGGAPVEANDVVFFVDLLKAALKENAGNYFLYTPGQFPDNVAGIRATGPDTVTIDLSGPVNVSWFTENVLTQIIPMPSAKWNRTDTETGLDFTDPAQAAKIYNYLNAQAKNVSAYATNPLWQEVDGPFAIQDYEANTAKAVLKANPRYTGPGKPSFSTYTLVPFTSADSELAALQSGQIDVAPIPVANVQRIPQIQRAGYRVYSGTASYYYPVYYNFKNTTGHFSSIIGQLYVRQALAHLQNQDAVVTGVYKGFATPSYGPLPSSPQTQFSSPSILRNPYSFDVSAAKNLLTQHGWNVIPNGTTTCAKPGTGPAECGAGIPAGTPLTWTLHYNSGPSTTRLQAESFASNARQAGITIDLVGREASYLIQNFSNVGNPSHANDWSMDWLGGQGGRLYPTTATVFDSTGSANQGSYRSPEADRLIKASLSGSDPAAVNNELEFLAKDQPALFSPARKTIWAWRTTMSGPPDAFASLSRGVAQPQYWYFTK
jgi:peptide/nickel transport system substrate-binding protein